MNNLYNIFFIVNTTIFTMSLVTTSCQTSANAVLMLSFRSSGQIDVPLYYCYKEKN